MDKLGFKYFFAYGFQEFALGFLTVMGVQYINFFMTDIALLPVAAVTGFLAIARIVDTVDVPIIGMVVERTNMKWGKYRSWLYIAAPLVMVFNFLMFSNFAASETVKLALIAGSYILGYVCVNFCSTARFALLPTFTSDPAERTKLAAWRGMGGSASQIVRGFATVPLVGALGALAIFGMNGYQSTVIIYGIIVIVGLYWIAGLAKPYDKGQAGAKQAKVGDMLKQLVTNVPLLILVLGNTILLIATNVLVAFNMYYMRYVFNSLDLMTIYLPITFAGGLLGNFIATLLLKRFGNKRTVYNIGVIFWVLGMLLVLLFAVGNVWVFIAFVAIAQFGAGISNAVVPAMFSDTADYAEWKTGKNVKAVNMGLVIFPIKLGVLFGGTIAGLGLAWAGFVANTTDPAVISSIRTNAALLPMIIGAVSAVIMIFYPLGKKKMEEITSELKARALAAKVDK